MVGASPRRRIGDPTLQQQQQQQKERYYHQKHHHHHHHQKQQEREQEEEEKEENGSRLYSKSKSTRNGIQHQSGRCFWKNHWMFVWIKQQRRRRRRKYEIFVFFLIGSMVLLMMMLLLPWKLTKMDYKGMSEIMPIMKKLDGGIMRIEVGPRPRTIGFYYPSSNSGNNNNSSSSSSKKNTTREGVDSVERLLTYPHKYPSKRKMKWTESDIAAKDLRENSKHYRHGRADILETEDCKAQYPWQLTSFPTCNILHEVALSKLYFEDAYDQILPDAPPYERGRLFGNGYWRDVWIFRDAFANATALKTLRYGHQFEERNYDRHRRDALAMERLTRSPHVMDIYAFCGNSGIFEYSPDGDLDHTIWPIGGRRTELTKLDKLRVATQVAMSLVDVHNIDKDGQASIAHTDITPAQFILVDGFFKLNDFNRCRFIRWNNKTNAPCTYTVGQNPGKFRSPEEYSYAQQSEKVDVYSMGNIFFSLVSEHWPWENKKSKEAQELVMNGHHPDMDMKYVNQSHIADRALLQAMVMCHERDPNKRSSAKEVVSFLLQELERAIALEDNSSHA